MNRKIELLAPAGDLEKLKIAVLYGADAVYLGGTSFGLRAKAKNFSKDEMREGVVFAHKHNAKVYVTCNIFAHNDDFRGMEEYFKFLREINVDAVLISDPGVFSVAREAVPNMDIHISTQANNTNYKTALFWQKLGAVRIVMARELSLKEIKDISDNIPKNLEIEAFVHGAMCISYSGRCLLSNYLSGRDANKGACSHPCRWKYALVEQTRPGEYMPIEEDERGTYIFNSKDLCMIEYIPELIDSGITSLKIEGRIKTSFYVGTVIKAYREAIDDYIKDPNIYYGKKEYYLDEVKKASYRGFTTGFYFGKPNQDEQIYTTSSYIRNYDFIGMVIDYDEKSGFATIEQRNKFVVGDEIEFLRGKGETFSMVVEEMYDEDGNGVLEAPHPQQIIKLKVGKKLNPFDMMRK
ncbi:MAG: U32 family peptidase [Clostridiales bacterium]|nr:U32 family peptidase [Clostridiales bacterium]